MIAVVLIIVGIAALGVASLLDLTPDTRDPEYGLGPFFSHRIRERAAHHLGGRA
jgi:hypothetical protein